MKKTLTYASLECKKMINGLPGIFIGTLIICLVLSIFLGLCRIVETNPKKNTTHIGVVAQKDEPYLDWVFQAVEDMKSIQLNCDFSFVSKTEGTRLLKDGSLSALFLIPKNYVASLIDGSNKVIRIQFADNQENISAFMIKQIANAASEYILDTEAGIYTLQDFYKAGHLENRKKDELALNIEYIRHIMVREQMITVEPIQSTGDLSNSGYYFCSAIILCLTLFGLSCSRILRQESHVLRQKLSMDGVSSIHQLLCRAFAFFLVGFIHYMVLGILVMLIFQMFSISIEGFPLSSTTDWIRFLVHAAPVLFLTNAFILFAYELFEDALSGIVFLFTFIIGFGFLCGLFYPLAYLPLSIQHLSRLLPFGVLFRYLSSCLTLTDNWSGRLNILGYTAILYALLILLRQLQNRQRRIHAI